MTLDMSQKCLGTASRLVPAQQTVTQTKKPVALRDNLRTPHTPPANQVSRSFVGGFPPIDRSNAEVGSRCAEVLIAAYTSQQIRVLELERSELNPNTQRRRKLL